MKARHFRKLRKKVKWYDVDTSWGLFGDFRRGFDIRVLARSHREACLRAKRRGYGLTYHIREYPTSENWARWRVKLGEKSTNFKNIAYY